MVHLPAKVTVWDPPRRFRHEGKDCGPDGPPTATEWIIEPRSRGRCLVRVVHGLFASADDWDNYLEKFEDGWPQALAILRLYLTRFRGDSDSTASITGQIHSAWGIEAIPNAWIRRLARLMRCSTANPSDSTCRHTATGLTSNRMIRLPTSLSAAVAFATLLLLVQAAWTAHAPEERVVAEERWAETLRFVRETFPDVPQLSTERLAEMLAQDADVVLLDARSEKEFETSHLQGATLATSVRAARKELAQHGGKPIVVVYCSVGYRSSRLAERLGAQGVENVFNLEGSLFKWANEGRPVYRGSKPVRFVHPFDPEWGKLLDKALWSE